LADVLGGLPALKRLLLADNGDFDTCEVVPTAAQRAAAPEVWDELIAACSGELELRKVGTHFRVDETKHCTTPLKSFVLTRATDVFV
jgi:hypothetical protein